MDFTDSTKVVYNRIQKLEPENVSKIIGYLLLQDHGEREMIRLAFSPDNLIYSLINKAKSDLGLNRIPVLAPISQVTPIQVPDVPLQFTPYSPVSSQPASAPAAARHGKSFWDAQVIGDQQQVHSLEFCQQGYSEPILEEFRLENQMQFLTLEDQLEFGSSMNSEFSSNYLYPPSALGPRASRRSPSLPEFPVKVCHYFSKGFCKHGSNCRYFHGHPPPDSFSQIFGLNSSDFGPEERTISPRSLEKLEFELTELLKSKRGIPVSIASLPMMYYEKFGRSLQAEGYLTESQRHGKAGYSLTKLLARLKNSIRVIDRPHGQHSVILVEDIPKYLEHAGERMCGLVSSANQIYLTFPAESTFTELDVSNYFSKFGPVQDVRIPCQSKRMFGFVTFVFTETVKQILSKGNPHFVCGARVLVKPYREKSRLCDRKYTDRIHHLMYTNPHSAHEESDFCSVSPDARFSENLRFRNYLIEEHEQLVEQELRHPALFQLGRRPTSHHVDFGYSAEEFKLAAEEQTDFTSSERFDYLLDLLNNGSTSDDQLRRISVICNDQDSGQGLKLPESLFAHAIGNGISTVT